MTGVKVLRVLASLFVILTIFSAAPQERVKVSESQRIKEGEVRGSNQQSNNLTIEQFIPHRLPDSPNLEEISAKSVYVIDTASGTALYKKEPDLPLPPASTTKIMTALVVLDEYRLDEIVAVPEGCLDLPGRKMGLVAEEKISVENLLYGLLVSSGSDAACALATHQDQSVALFVEKMNQKAQSLGLENTRFTNPVGLDETDGEHFSSAKDLVKLGQEALKSGIFRKIVGTKEINLSSEDQRRWHKLEATNELLLSFPGTTGVKTGSTEDAGGCLVFSYERLGREILGAILGSADRFGEARKLIEWVFRVYEWD